MRATAVAEAEIRAADVQQPIIVVTRRCRRVERQMAKRVKWVHDDMRDPEQLAVRSIERRRGWIARAPFSHDIEVGRVGDRESGRNEVRRGRIAVASCV